MQIGIVSGLPPLQAGRKVTIYSPARTAGQQGVSQTALGERHLQGDALKLLLARLPSRGRHRLRPCYQPALARTHAWTACRVH